MQIIEKYLIDDSIALALLRKDLEKDKKTAPWTRKLLGEGRP